ncbi:MAG TPA: phosphotransferase [Gemmataceae bacterium]|nr:phosphotransferase [Gemmataceae bacterium]
MNPPPDAAARHVLARYALPVAALQCLGNHGGFSGARLWRLESAGASFCLRAWPADDPTPERLRKIHDRMTAARAAGLEFVPAVLPAGGATFFAHAGRLWDLTAWMPGRSDFHRNPAPARLRAACVALARLHLAWAARFPGHGTCPALARRLDRAADWLALVSSGWRPRTDDGDPVRPWAEAAARLLPAWVGRVAPLLAPWADRRFALHPCLCDVWHDHVLFDGDAVSGIVDYGSVKVDHAAADLARLLGSLVGDDAAGWADGLDTYTSVRPLSPDEQALARALDRTGVILGAANWLKWLYHNGRAFPDQQVIADRLAGLVRRIEQWSP